jgi:hypothetical protein
MKTDSRVDIVVVVVVVVVAVAVVAVITVTENIGFNVRPRLPDRVSRASRPDVIVIVMGPSRQGYRSSTSRKEHIRESWLTLTLILTLMTQRHTRWR